MTPLEFLCRVFDDDTDTERVCVSKSFVGRDGKTGFYNAFLDDAGFRRWCDTYDRAQGSWYYSVATVTGAVNDRGRARRGRDQLVSVWVLVLDDIGTKATEPPLEPTYKLETSRGNWQWGYLLEPTTDFDRYERLLAWCGAQGWTDSGAGGSYRVVRLPGSYNAKPDAEGWRARLGEADWDRWWSLDDLIADLGADLSTVTAAAVTPAMGGVRDVGGVVRDPVLEWLEGRGLVQEDRGDWVTIRCPNAGEHTDGRDGAGYSPLGRGASEWQDKRAFKCLHEHCKNKGTGWFLEWVREEGGPAAVGFDPLPFVQQRYVFVQRGSQVCDLDRRREGAGMRSLQTLTDWSNAHHVRVPTGGRGQPPLLKTVWLGSAETRKVYDVGFLPGLTDREVYTDPDMGGEMLNLYVPPAWPEKDKEGREWGPPTLMLRHVEALLPDACERALFWDWLAWKVQHPDRRPYAVLMVTDGAQGIGRSVLGKMLGKMMPGKVAGATLGHLLGRPSGGDATYNDWATGETQWVVVEESRQTLDPDAFYRGYEVFKEMVDPAPRLVTINRKYGAKRAERLYFAALMFSNHVDALHIPGEDRRVCVLRNSDKKRDIAEYQELWDEFYNEDGVEHIRLWWWLRRREVTGDFAVAPMTPAKRAMLGATMTTQDEWADDLREEWSAEGRPDPRWITRRELEDYAADWYRRNGLRREPQPREVERVWRSLSDPEPGSRVRVRVDGVQYRVRRVPSTPGS